MLKEDKAEMFEKLEQLYNKCIFDNRYIVIFGSNEPAERMADWLISHKIMPDAMIDNNEKKQGTFYKDIIIDSPGNVLGSLHNNALILIASKYFNEMAQQLELMGYKKEKHICQVVDMAKWSTFSITEDTFINKKIEIIKGWEIYKNIVGKYGNETRIFICPYCALGDVYLVGKYLGDYCKKMHIASYLVTVIGSSCKKVLNLFGISQIEVLKQDESNRLLQTLIFYGLKECNTEILHHRLPYTAGIGVLGNYRNICFNSHFKYTIFNMEEKDSGKLPQKTEDSSFIDNYFEQNGMVKGKTVIMSPYANTVTSLPDGFWEETAITYKNKGYIVCTNSCGAEEPAIKGTKPVFFPLTEAISIVEAAGIFIGLRSGLCDVISSAKAEKIIIYPDRVYQGGKYIDFYSLKNMGLSEEAEERII